MQGDEPEMADIKALIATGGGYGSQRILPLLDYKVIRKNPKIVTCGDVHDQSLDLSIEKTLFSCLTNQSYCIEKGIGTRPGISV